MMPVACWTGSLWAPKKSSYKGEKNQRDSYKWMFDTQAKNQDTHTGVSKQEAESIITILQLPGIRVQNKEVSELPHLFRKRHAAGIL
jgi:hypothetical protein